MFHSHSNIFSLYYFITHLQEIFFSGLTIFLLHLSFALIFIHPCNVTLHKLTLLLLISLGTLLACFFIPFPPLFIGIKRGLVLRSGDTWMLLERIKLILVWHAFLMHVTYTLIWHLWHASPMHTTWKVELTLVWHGSPMHATCTPLSLFFYLCYCIGFGGVHMERLNPPSHYFCIVSFLFKKN